MYSVTVVIFWFKCILVNMKEIAERENMSDTSSLHIWKWASYVGGKRRGRGGTVNPKTNIMRLVTRHDCLSSLPGDGDKLSEMCTVRWGKTFFTWLARAAKAGQTFLVPARWAQQTNQHSYALLESPFASVSTASTGHSLQSPKSLL